MAPALADHLSGLRRALDASMVELRDGRAADARAALKSALAIDSLDAPALFRRLAVPEDGLAGEAADVWDAVSALIGAALAGDWQLDVHGIGAFDSTGAAPHALDTVSPLDPATVVTMQATGGDGIGGATGVSVGRVEIALDLGNARISLRAAAFELRAEDPTGFLALLGAGAFAVRGDVGAVFDADGFRFTGGSRKQVELAASAPSVLGDPRFELEHVGPSELAVTASFRGELAGMTAVVDRIGVAARLDAEASVQYRPPRGVGLSLAGVGGMSGGGLLAERDGGYGGMLNLDVGPVEVTAFGLLHPRPFSLIIVLSAQFEPGIQLSFGFALGGVGGIVGIGHRVDTGALAESVQQGTLDHLLFPADPVAGAPAILSSLARVFPRQPGNAVFGPLFRVTWGPVIPLVTADLGVILELPEARFAILGRLRVALPHPELAIVDLRASLAGIVDPGRGLVEINVSLSGSRVSGFPVSGGLVVRVESGGGGEFIFSAGGFHPRYTPPAGLPVPQRLEIKLADLPLLQITFRGYFALTSGSVQAGARLDLVAGDPDTGISGTLGFDALLRWSPSFAFTASLYGSFAFRFAGETICSVSIDVMLEGPSPCWHVAGRASVELLFIEISFAVDESWGRQAEPALPPPDVVGTVLRALERPEAWAPVMPEGSAGILRLRVPKPGEPVGTIHPLGQLVVRQEVAPLKTPITRFGSAPLPGPTTLTITGTPGAGLETSDVPGRFAAGQFFTLTEDQLLTQPAFADFHAGVVVQGAEATTSPTARVVTVAYEDKTIGPSDGGTRFGLLSPSLLGAAVANGAVGRSALHAARSRYAAQEAPRVAVRPEAGRLLAVDIHTWAVVTTIAGITHAEATQALAASARSDVTLAAAWEVAE